MLVFAATEHPRKQRCGEYISHKLHSPCKQKDKLICSVVNFNWVYCTLWWFYKIWGWNLKIKWPSSYIRNTKGACEEPTPLIEEGNIDRKIPKSHQNWNKARSHVLCAKVKDHLTPQLLPGFSKKDIFVLEASNKVLFLLLLMIWATKWSNLP